MPKTWEQLTAAEKIEDSRLEIIRLMEAVNALNRRVDADGASIAALRERLKAAEAQADAH